MRTRVVRSLLVSCACMAAALMVACGGGGSSTPNAIFVTPTPSSSPVAVPIAPGSTLSATGSQGVTFSFSFGNGVPAGETARLAAHALPTPVPSVRPGGQPGLPADEVSIVVGPSALPLSAITSFAYTGVNVLSPVPYSLWLIDTASQGWTVFNTIGSGPLALANSGATPPITTLQPGREYLLQLYPYRAQVFPPGAYPFGAGVAVGAPNPATGNMFYLELTAALPLADEWYTLQMGPPPGVGTLVNTYVDGFTMTIGPSPIPASWLAGVLLLPNTEFPAGTTFRAQIADVTGATYGSSASLPYALGPPHSAPVTPTSYQPSPPLSGTPLTQLTPGDTYWVSIYRN